MNSKTLCAIAMKSLALAALLVCVSPPDSRADIITSPISTQGECGLFLSQHAPPPTPNELALNGECIDCFTSSVSVKFVKNTMNGAWTCEANNVTCPAGKHKNKAGTCVPDCTATQHEDENRNCVNNPTNCTPSQHKNKAGTCVPNCTGLQDEDANGNCVCPQGTTPPNCTCPINGEKYFDSIKKCSKPCPNPGFEPPNCANGCLTAPYTYYNPTKNVCEQVVNCTDGKQAPNNDPKQCKTTCTDPEIVDPANPSQCICKPGTTPKSGGGCGCGVNGAIPIPLDGKCPITCTLPQQNFKGVCGCPAPQVISGKSCALCTGGRFYKDGACACPNGEAPDGTCKSSAPDKCPDQKTVKDKTGSNCPTCPDKKTLTDATGSNCPKCLDGKTVKNPTGSNCPMCPDGNPKPANGECRKECPGGIFVPPTSNCPEKCPDEKTVKNGTGGNCPKCLDEKTLTDPTGSNCPKCPDGKTQKNPTGSNCSTCPTTAGAASSNPNALVGSSAIGKCPKPDKCQQILAAIAAEIGKLNKLITTAQDELIEKTEKKNNWEKEKSELEPKLGALQAKIKKNLEAQEYNLAGQKFATGDELKDLKKELERLKRRLETLQKKYDDLSARWSELDELLRKIEPEIYFLEKRLDWLAKEVDKLNKLREDTLEGPICKPIPK